MHHQAVGLLGHLQRGGTPTAADRILAHLYRAARDWPKARAVAARLGVPFYVVDVTDAFRRDVIDAFVADFNDIITSVIYGLLSRYSAGEIAVTDILPILDRSVYRLTRGY